jgi:hypothetical protein
MRDLIALMFTFAFALVFLPQIRKFGSAEFIRGYRVGMSSAIVVVLVYMVFNLVHSQ